MRNLTERLVWERKVLKKNPTTLRLKREHEINTQHKYQSQKRYLFKIGPRSTGRQKLEEKNISLTRRPFSRRRLIKKNVFQLEDCHPNSKTPDPSGDSETQQKDPILNGVSLGKLSISMKTDLAKQEVEN